MILIHLDNKLIYLFIFFLLSTSIMSEDVVIQPYKNKFALQELRNDRNDIYPESNIYLYLDPIDEKIIISSEQENYFAICNTDFTNILIDLNGNGVASELFDSLNVPFWVMRKNSVIDPNNKEFIDDLHKIYKCFEEKIQPVENQKYLEIMDRLANALRHKDYVNRDLYYLIYLHSVSHNRDSVWSPHAINTLLEETEKRFNLNKIPAVFYIYQLEYSYKNNLIEESKEILSEALDHYPRSSVFNIYNYIINKDVGVRLKNRYINHWLYLNIE